MSERAEIEVPQADLHAYVDGQLTPARRRAVETWLAAHPMMAATLDGWRAQNASIRELFADGGDEAQIAADWRRIRALRARQDRPRPRWIAPAVGAGLFAVGMLAGGAAMLQWRAASPAAASVPGGGPPALPEASRDVWLVYAGDSVHPVEIGAKAAGHLNAWLGRRLDVPFRAPDLNPVGLRLIGGRLVPYGTAPGAVLLYEDGAGRRAAVLAVRAPSAGADDLRFSRSAGVGTVTWHEAGLDFALSAPFPRARLAELATAFRNRS